jgi:hypothetical protein
MYRAELLPGDPNRIAINELWFGLSSAYRIVFAVAVPFALSPLSP